MDTRSTPIRAGMQTGGIDQNLQNINNQAHEQAPQQLMITNQNPSNPSPQQPSRNFLGPGVDFMTSYLRHLQVCLQIKRIKSIVL